MSTADHFETPQAWPCGEYRVEFAAPRLWVVTRETAASSGRTKVVVEATTGSLITAHGMVARLHRKYCTERLLMVRLMTFAAAVAASVLITTVDPSLAVPAFLGSTIAAGRAVVSAIELSVGRSWEQVSHTYQ